MVHFTKSGRIFMRKIQKQFVSLLVVYCLVLPFTAIAIESPEPEKQFPNSILSDPRLYGHEIVNKFQYSESDTFITPNDSLSLVLKNGYASANIIHQDSISYPKENYRVKTIKLVYTKYPFYKEDWLTNYYDLLAWRLQELFRLDSTLNNKDIEWELVAQTSCKTASDAKEYFHGIVLYLEPTGVIAEDIPRELETPETKDPEGIPNGGFLFKEERNPDYYRSRLEFTPEPGKELRRNMDPKKLKCPTWR